MKLLLLNVACFILAITFNSIGALDLKTKAAGPDLPTLSTPDELRKIEHVYIAAKQYFRGEQSRADYIAWLAVGLDQTLCEGAYDYVCAGHTLDVIERIGRPWQDAELLAGLQRLTLLLWEHAANWPRGLRIRLYACSAKLFDLRDCSTRELITHMHVQEARLLDEHARIVHAVQIVYGVK